MSASIYYFTVEGISSSVFESQVNAYVSALRGKGIPVQLIIGQRLKARVSLKKFFNLRFQKHTEFVFLPQNIDFQKAAKRLLKRLPKTQKTVLHCRNIEAAYIGWLVQQQRPNIRVLYDVRGYVEDEMRYFGNPKAAELYSTLNKELFNAPIAFNFVSQRLFDLYTERYQVQIKDYIICVSAYNDLLFKPSFKELSITKAKPKLIFVGGSQAYQKIDSLVKLIEAHGGIEFTVVTNKKISIADAKTTRFLSGLTASEVSEILDEMDYGVIYRGSEALNEVATPTKIAEYWGKGLKVLAINSAGAYTPIIKEKAFLGYVFDKEEDFLKEHLAKVDATERAKVASFAKENYSLSANYMKYMLLYHKLIK